MTYQIERYAELLGEAHEEAERQKTLVRMEIPRLKEVSGADDNSNWCIFESVSKAYLEAMERVSAFEAIRQRAQARLADASRGDEAVFEARRDALVAALRSLANFSAQSHIVVTVTDVVSAFLKNPRLMRSKFLKLRAGGDRGYGEDDARDGDRSRLCVGGHVRGGERDPRGPRRVRRRI